MLLVHFADYAGSDTGSLLGGVGRRLMAYQRAAAGKSPEEKRRLRKKYGIRKRKRSGGFLGGVVRAASGAVKSVARAAVAPVSVTARLGSDIARGRNVGRSFTRAGRELGKHASTAATVASFIPGGQVVSAGISAVDAVARGKSLRSIAESAAVGALPGGRYTRAAVTAAAAIGRGESVKDAVLSAGRGALPSGAARLGWDAAVGVARGKNVSAVAMRAARGALELPESAAAFDAAAAVALKASRSEVAALARRLPARLRSTLVRPYVAAARAAAPTIGGKVVQFRGGLRNLKRRALSDRAGRFVRGSIVRAAREVRGLEADGASYRVEAGDSAWRITQRLIGAGNRYRELIAANPQKRTATTNGVLNFTFLKVGEVLKVPDRWREEARAKLPPPPPSPVVVALPPPATVPTPAAPPPVPTPSADSKVRIAAGETWRLGLVMSRTIAISDHARLEDMVRRQLSQVGTLKDIQIQGADVRVTLLYTRDAELVLGMSVQLTETVAVTLASATRLSVAGERDDVQAVAQAKLLLIAWEKSDGVAAGGLPDYGSREEDRGPLWGSRDNWELRAFVTWWNRKGHQLDASGDLTQAKLDALTKWAEERALEQAAGAVAVTPEPAPGEPAAPVAAPVATPVATPVSAPPAAAVMVPETEITGDTGSGWGWLLAVGLGVAVVASSSSKRKRAS